MVQADHPEMVMVSKEFAHKVIFCVIDTGLDRKNGEFSTSRKSHATALCVYMWPIGSPSDTGMTRL
jgi:hypothetical protein